MSLDYGLGTMTTTTFSENLKKKIGKLNLRMPFAFVFACV